MKNKKNYRFLKNDEKYPNFFKRLFSPVKFYIRDYYIYNEMKAVFIVSVNNKNHCFGGENKQNIFDKTLDILKNKHGIDVNINEITLKHSSKRHFKYKIFTETELQFLPFISFFYRNHVKIKFIEYNYDRLMHCESIQGRTRYTTQYCVIVDDKILRSNVNQAGYYACQELYDKLNFEYGIPFRVDSYSIPSTNEYWIRSSELKTFK